jgi:hypothetical protein
VGSLDEMEGGRFSAGARLKGFVDASSTIWLSSLILVSSSETCQYLSAKEKKRHRVLQQSPEFSSAQVPPPLPARY